MPILQRQYCKVDLCEISSKVGQSLRNGAKHMGRGKFGYVQ